MRLPPCHLTHHTHHTHHTQLAALRAAIQQFVEANPSFQSELYQAQATQAREPVVPNRSTSGEWAAAPVQSATAAPVQSATLSEIATVKGMPMDTPVATVTAERVAERGASASAGPVVVLWPKRWRDGTLNRLRNRVLLAWLAAAAGFVGLVTYF